MTHRFSKTSLQRPSYCRFQCAFMHIHMMQSCNPVDPNLVWCTVHKVPLYLCDLCLSVNIKIQNQTSESHHFQPVQVALVWSQSYKCWDQRVLKERRNVIGQRRVIFPSPQWSPIYYSLQFTSIYHFPIVPLFCGSLFPCSVGHCALVPSHGPAWQIAKVVPHWIPWVTIDDRQSAFIDGHTKAESRAKSVPLPMLTMGTLGQHQVFK